MEAPEQEQPEPENQPVILLFITGEQLLSFCNSLELATAVASTNWHWQQIADAAQAIITNVIPFIRYKPAGLREIKRRLVKTHLLALKKQKLPHGQGNS